MGCFTVAVGFLKKPGSDLAGSDWPTGQLAVAVFQASNEIGQKYLNSDADMASFNQNAMTRLSWKATS